MSTLSREQIARKITSEAPDVLSECLRFVDDRLAKESDRARNAENRAIAMVALIAAAVFLLISIADELPVMARHGRFGLSLVSFAGATLFLLKSAYYAIRTLGVLVEYRVKVQSVFAVQSLALAEALRDELVGKIWECLMAEEPNTYRLYQLQRCQRSLVFAIFFSMAVGATFLLDSAWLGSAEPCAVIAVGSLSILSLAFADPLIERLGIWKNSPS